MNFSLFDFEKLCEIPDFDEIRTKLGRNSEKVQRKGLDILVKAFKIRHFRKFIVKSSVGILFYIRIWLNNENL
jgi:hypothetical protein